MAYDENYPQGDGIPKGPDTSWLNTPGATGPWKDAMQYFYNAKSPDQVKDNGFYLARPGSTYDANTGMVTIGNQLNDAGLAAKQNADAGLMNGGWIPGLALGALAGGVTGMIPGTTSAFGSGTAAATSSMFSDLPTWAGGAPAIADTALGGGAAGAGLGAAGSAGVSASLADFGLSSFGGAASSGLGIDLANSPFSFPGVSGAGGSTLPQIPGFSDNLPSWADSPTTPASTGAPNPLTAPTAGGSGASLDPESLIKKYGFDAGRAILNYFQNQGLADQASKAGQSASALNDPRRQPFINQATQNVLDPNAFLNNPKAQAILAQLNAQRQADYGKHGYGGTDVSKWDTQTAAKMAELLNDEQKSLLPYTGFDQNNTQTAYLSQRDNLAFKTQSYQGFTALAAKIGGDKGAQSAISDAASALGKSIMSFFS